ncbi:hypothetical protein VTN00DRAFT_3766 [Thermoascus crustaceus]|uniref:uncharacterized protein n=1 Tax=Thermoascus crustaceus TaxID=5088 RepID=UPI003743C57E
MVLYTYHIANSLILKVQKTEPTNFSTSGTSAIQVSCILEDITRGYVQISCPNSGFLIVPKLQRFGTNGTPCTSCLLTAGFDI